MALERAGAGVSLPSAVITISAPAGRSWGKFGKKPSRWSRPAQNRCNYLRFFRQPKKIRLQFFAKWLTEKNDFGRLATFFPDKPVITGRKTPASAGPKRFGRDSGRISPVSVDLKGFGRGVGRISPVQADSTGFGRGSGRNSPVSTDSPIVENKQQSRPDEGRL